MPLMDEEMELVALWETKCLINKSLSFQLAGPRECSHIWATATIPTVKEDRPALAVVLGKSLEKQNRLD